MEKGSKLRLVRCPKCENLLPQLPDFSVYQCGGCGALLRTEKLDDEGGGEGLGVGIERVMESGGVSIESSKQKDNASSTSHANLIGISSTRTEIETNPMLSAMNISRERISKGEKGVYSGDRYPQESRGIVHDGVNRNYHEMSVGRERSEHGRRSLENEGRYRSRVGDYPGSLRPKPDMERKYPSFPYNDDSGPSNYQHRAFYSSAEQKRIHGDMDGPSRVENLENDRAELLRKLDELQEQLKRYEVTDKPPSHVPHLPEGSVLPNPTRSYVPQGPKNMYTVDRQIAAEHPYLNHHKGHGPYVRGGYVDVQNFHPQRNAPNEVLGHMRSHVPQSSQPPYEPPSRYLTQPYANNFNRTSLASHQYQHDTSLHHPMCSCLQCYNQNQQVPSRAMVDSRPRNDHLASSVTYDPWSYNHRGAYPPDQHLLKEPGMTRGSTYTNLDGFGHANQHPGRAVVAQARRPLAGGAPFITCQACFDLLELPRKVVMAKKLQKVRCGACSAVILIKIDKKGLFVSLPPQFENTLTSVDDGSEETSSESIQHPVVNCLNAGAIASCSDDFDNAGYNFQLTETEYVLPTEEKLNVGESPCSSFSEDDQSPDSVIIQDMSHDADLTLKDEVPLLPFQDPENGPSSNIVNRNGPGNKSKRDNHEKTSFERVTSRQNSLKDVSLATEEAISFDEAPNVVISRESSKDSKDEDRRRTNKGSESFLAGLIKKSFKDLSRSSQSSETVKANVFVNGYPISDRVIKKAEKIAGPIQPGNYWYDYQAGFWGAMGHPCLGIIPPFIEEFNIPLPEDCGAGNTGVYVNGRELHEKDLNLLASRGLPTARDRYYVVEMSGKVVDEFTGEELDGLGKLAPTIEKVKHGFGMKIPRSLISPR